MDLEITKSIEDGKMTEYPTNVKELFDNINRMCRVFPFVSNCAYEEIPLLEGGCHRYVHSVYALKAKWSVNAEEILVKAIWDDLKEFLGGHGKDAVIMWRSQPYFFKSELENDALINMRFAIKPNADVSYKPASYKVAGEEVMLIGE